MTSVSRSTDIVYVVQVLPDGTRRLAILDGVLDLLYANTQSDAGNLHLANRRFPRYHPSHRHLPGEHPGDWSADDTEHLRITDKSRLP